ncbi:hypothetical protein [Nocardioides sp. L-11A]|uniref:hypothetical protein n=1 Tax=Nocardioides sp. L-11A TaxID=3043848 RepID=UPI00249A3DAE|nr:hypothetical protein QJ852_09860 [Nocardioides sp. L-11A]
MPVVVRQSGPREAKHPDGVDIKIVDGHLHVLRGGSNTLAIYTPGNWMWAEVTKADA